MSTRDNRAAARALRASQADAKKVDVKDSLPEKTIEKPNTDAVDVKSDPIIFISTVHIIITYKGREQDIFIMNIPENDATTRGELLTYIFKNSPVKWNQDWLS